MEKLTLKSLIDNVEPIKNAKQVYSAFEKKKRPLSTLFKYDTKNEKIIKPKIIY